MDYNVYSLCKRVKKTHIYNACINEMEKHTQFLYVYMYILKMKGEYVVSVCLYSAIMQ